MFLGRLGLYDVSISPYGALAVAEDRPGLRAQRASIGTWARGRRRRPTAAAATAMTAADLDDGGDVSGGAPKDCSGDNDDDDDQDDDSNDFRIP
eukprot:5407807-Pyramimonas_sp.AAC.1